MKKRSTIVRYRADLPPENAYPRQIVSPMTGGPCCILHSRETGKVRREGGWRYIYVRCQVCGYTVRRILGRITPRSRRPGMIEIPKRRGVTRVASGRSGLARALKSRWMG